MTEQEHNMFLGFLEMLQTDAQREDMRGMIEYYEKELNVPEHRQVELIAFVSVQVQHSIDKKFSHFYEPAKNINDYCQSKEEATIALYNFGRAMETVYNTQGLQNVPRETSEEDEQ